MRMLRATISVLHTSLRTDMDDLANFARTLHLHLAVEALYTRSSHNPNPHLQPPRNMQYTDMAVSNNQTTSRS
jgi:hypothetical protein